MASPGVVLALFTWVAAVSGCNGDGVDVADVAALQVPRKLNVAPETSQAAAAAPNRSSGSSSGSHLRGHRSKQLRAMVGDAPSCDDSTDSCPDVVNNLNALMMAQGVFVRQPEDNNVESDCTVGSFWHANVAPPNVMYIWNEGEGLLYWQWPAVGYVIGSQLDTFYPGGLDSGDYAVYAHDSNACDAPSGGGIGRCWYNEDDSLWNCPGVYQDDSGKYWSDDSSLGAGSTGGRGCHTDGQETDGQWLNQGEAWLGDGTSTLESFAGSDCACSTAASDESRVNEWVAAVKAMRDDSLDGFLDPWICYQNNNFAAVNLQNELWWQSGSDYTQWWGWNEVPIGNPAGPGGGWPGKPNPDDPQYWDAVLIYLPTGSWDDANQRYTAWDEDTGRDVMEKQLADMESKLQMGVSAVVFAKEYVDPDRDNSYQRSFFCNKWQGATYEICLPDATRDYCFIQKLGCCDC